MATATLSLAAVGTVPPDPAAAAVADLPQDAHPARRWPTRAGVAHVSAAHVSAAHVSAAHVSAAHASAAHTSTAHACGSRDDADRMAPVHLLAHQLAEEIRTLAADARAGRAEVPLAVHPALLASFALEALTGPDVTAQATDLRALRLRQVARSLRGAADLLDELATFD
ncbi:hypothetical protein CC117_19630 [Parafrankia colletiae]|uniref:Uncharacterized protein n=1 Tax=Parafrankia colletiae TaxID=573497 RepID=A0A1S1QPF2_9ACTN|nr:hypothetical protein CC117_19630 [Parafrankia colletiae]